VHINCLIPVYVVIVCVCVGFSLDYSGNFAGYSWHHLDLCGICAACLGQSFYGYSHHKLQ